MFFFSFVIVVMICFVISTFRVIDRRLWGESNREVSMAPACVIPSLGLWSSISALVGACPCGWCLT